MISFNFGTHNMLTELTPYLPNLLTVITIYFIACVSPGPDMAMTVRNTLRYSHKIAMIGVLGTTCGMMMHLTYTFLGVEILVNEFPWLQEVFKYVGAAWLMYIGYKSLMTKVTVSDNLEDNQPVQSIRPAQIFRLSFFTNALNPFVILLFIGIISNEIDIDTPYWIQGVFAVTMVIVGFAWFTFLALCFSYKPIKNTFVRMGPWLDRVTGAILILFAIKLAFAAVK